MTDASVNEAARLLRVSRARIYQLAKEGALDKNGPLVSLESVCERIFRIQGHVVTYLPLQWSFELHRPAPSWWPPVGAQTHDRSAAVVSNSIPAELREEPELAAKIARLALDWATR